MKHTFSVVLCAYTEARWDDLVEAVVSVQRQTLIPHEIIVAVDHNPRLFARIQRHLPGVVVVENREARGLSGTRNSGLAVAGGTHVVFLDDDAIAAPDWLARLQAVFANSRAIGAGGAIEPLWLGGRPAWFPPEFDWVIGCTYRGMPETRATVRNLIGCNMAFRKEVFATVGGFRIGRVGALSIGQENDETEFCIRLTATCPDKELWYEPAAVVRHTVPPSRATLAYFSRRCFSEGLSKAKLSRQVGRAHGLSAERAYMLRALPQGVLRGFGDTLLRRDASGVLRAGAIIAGLMITAAGYLAGSTSQWIGGRLGARMFTRKRTSTTSDILAAEHPISSPH
jgi:glycosyltransferase involved in cell wall biosynthesis